MYGAIERSGSWGSELQRRNIESSELNSIVRGANEVDLMSRRQRISSGRSKHRGTPLPLPVAALFRALAWLNQQVEAQLRAWRWGRPVQTFSLLVFSVAQAFFTAGALASESLVRFDVPSLTEAVVNEVGPSDDGLMVIELTIPVSSEINGTHRNDVTEFRYDVRWQHARYPVIDYGPRTKTTSKIDGTIGIETENRRNATFGLALNSGDNLTFAGSAKAEAARKDAEKRHYQEIPQHDVLVASGTLDRGTGAFFRFHHSRRETLEGSRDLSIAFRVPVDWQAGLLRVKCRASGEQKVAGLWTDPIEIVQSFTLPVYLGSSLEARDRAVEYVRAERGFQQLVARRQSIEQAAKPSGVESMFRGLLGLKDNKTQPDNRTRREPQSRVVRYRVPTSASDVSGRYRNAREELLRLSR